jgi:hypothetical protein
MRAGGDAEDQVLEDDLQQPGHPGAPVPGGRA